MMGGMGGMGGMMGGMGMGGMGGFGSKYGSASRGPMGNNFWQGNQQGQGMNQMVGQLRNPAIVGQSATVFSDHVDRISTNDLLGRGIALCKHVQNGQCVGTIPYCCTIARDNLPGMEISVRPGMNGPGGMGGMQGGMGGMGAMGGMGGPGGMGGMGGGQGGMGGMGGGVGFGSQQGGQGGGLGGLGGDDSSNGGGLF